MPRAYYNEFDPYAAQWLRNLIAAGHIAPGDVDQRSIEDVTPLDLTGYTQCHFFAGIGVWSYALRRAGWPDSRPVWTGSCPCQPFSAAGKGNGFADERHLWPAWFHLISQRQPGVILGEQVSSKDADIWIDLVQTDMEALGYAFGAVPFPSAGVGAPHIRDRLYWLADSNSQRSGRDGRSVHSPENGVQGSGNSNGRNVDRFGNGCATDRLDNTDDAGLEGFGSGHKTEGGRVGEVRPVATASELSGLADPNEQQRHGSGDGRPTGRGEFANDRALSGLADAPDSTGHGSQPRGIIRELPQGVGAMQTECRPTGPVNGRWSNADWLLCRDGKWRPVEPGTFPLANGAPARVGRLRAYGNAINAEAAEAVIRSYMECRP